MFFFIRLVAHILYIVAVFNLGIAYFCDGELVIIFLLCYYVVSELFHFVSMVISISHLLYL